MELVFVDKELYHILIKFGLFSFISNWIIHVALNIYSACNCNKFNYVFFSYQLLDIFHTDISDKKGN